MKFAAALFAVACGSTPPPKAPDAVAPATCDTCHSEVSASWAGSAHAEAETDASGTVPLDGGQPFTRRIGREPLWQPLLDGPDGRVQVSSLAYDVARGAWFDLFATDPRSPGDWGHWTGRGMTWNRQCAHCHATGVDQRYDPALDRYDTTVAAHGVTCAACHPSDGGHPSAPADRATAQETCLPCHTRGTPLSAFAPGRPLLDRVSPSWPDLTPVYEVDGQVREEAFEGAAFGLSRMASAGVTCLDCHDPHTGGLRATGDALCLGCHDAALASADHTHHTTPTACVACHMPPTTYMAVDVRHDHRLSVPDPGLAHQTGGRTACDRCHAIDAALITAAEAWWPPDPARRAPALALHGLRDGTLGAQDAWRAALADASGPWRAVLLAVAPADADPRPMLEALAATDGSLRLGAARGLQDGPSTRGALLGALADPLRAVRLEAGRALIPGLPPTDPRMAEVREWLTAQGDEPSAALELASWHQAAGDAAQAVSWARRAAALDPRSVPALRTLAVTLATAGRPQDALRAAERAAELAPDDPTVLLPLALARAEAGDPAGAEAALRRLLTLVPDHPRATWNLGLLLDARGAPEAVTLLTRAARLLPDDPGPPWALGLAAQRAGRVSEARAQATEALRRAPGHEGATALLRSLDGVSGAGPGSPGPSTAQPPR